FSAIIFFAPELGGWFLEADNFTPSDPLTTPPHIVPLWYFTPYYSILRAVTWEWLPGGAKLWGVIAMGASLIVLFFLPWLDKSPVRSIRYRGGIFKAALTIFIIAFFLLGWLGTQPAEGINTLLAQISMFIYFGFFLLMPIYTRLDKTKPVPERLT
ncbi:MAG: cytochrome b, partial [Gammaproteobacteria bacterium]|nr:cytochrome b [Gammaproteobacteria bacterium]MDX2488821.1 cytochrome b [Gammaproteobacteria bacterium]